MPNIRIHDDRWTANSRFYWSDQPGAQAVAEVTSSVYLSSWPHKQEVDSVILVDTVVTFRLDLHGLIV